MILLAKTDEKVRNELLYPLVDGFIRKCVRGFCDGQNDDDYMQAGVLGFLAAVRRYRGGCKFLETLKLAIRHEVQSTRTRGYGYASCHSTYVRSRDVAAQIRTLGDTENLTLEECRERLKISADRLWSTVARDRWSARSPAIELVESRHNPVFSAEVRDEVARALSRVPEDLREVFAARFGRRASISECCNILGRNETRTKRALIRAMRKARSA
jgi:RNA polymerase sigma factor (sigma-70 family)